MRQTPDAASAHLPVPAERSILAALFDLVRCLGFIFSVVYLASAASSYQTMITNRFDWGSWWFLDIGRAFLIEANWLLPTFLAIVLAFYAALIGQSVANTPPDDVFRTRRRLVPAGLIIASLVLAFLAAAVLAAFASPDQWPRLPGIVLVTVAISMLGVGVGKFESRSLQFRLESAKRQLETRLKARDNLPAAPHADTRDTSQIPRTTRPVLVIGGTIVLAVTIPTAPILIFMVVNGAPLQNAVSVTLQFLLINLIWAVIGVGIPLTLIGSSYNSAGFWRAAKRALAALFALFLTGNASIFVLQAIAAPTFDFDSLIAILPYAIPHVVVCVLVLVSFFAPDAMLHSKVGALTLRSAIVEQSRQNGDKEILRLEGEIAALEPPAVTAAPEPGGSRLRRALHILRHGEKPASP